MQIALPKDPGHPLRHGYRPVSYSEDEIQTLRLVRVSVLLHYLVGVLSNDKVLCVPVRVSPALHGAALAPSFRWEIADNGQTLIWSSGSSEPARLSLRTMLLHPDTTIGELRAFPA